MKVVSSNRLDALADRLARTMATSPLDPFVDDIIVVQNSGMQRWVSLALAERIHVLAGCRFPFPMAFFDTIAQDLLPAEPVPVHNDLDVFAFRVMGLLPTLRELPEAASIHRYLGESPDELKAYQLSRRIARTFDQYAVYRPEMVKAWDRGGAKHWQAHLWRLLFPQGNHRAARLDRLMALLHETGKRPSGLPVRVSVFGIANLPPVFLDLFAGLSRHLAVSIYFLNPSREYWGDVLSAREQRRLQQWSGMDQTPAAAEDLHLTPPDRILAAFGTVGRDFFDRLAGNDADFEDAFVSPGTQTLLHRVQQGMLDLASNDPESMAQTPGPAHTPADGSILVDACHTPLRAVEVLRDRLLRLFDADSTLSPHDVIIMTPAIEDYAPLIKAVFEGSGPPRIPVSISDRNLLADNGSARAFLRLLTVAKGRLGASEVMGLLEEPVIRDRFGIHASDLPICRSWVHRSGTRWGVDGSWRGRRGADPVFDTTWQAGVDRLMAGFIMGDTDHVLPSGIVPVSGIGDDHGDMLAGFLDFLEAAMALPDRLAPERTPAKWSRALGKLMDDFLGAASETEETARWLSAIIESLAWDIGEPEPSIGLDAIHEWLNRRCSAETVSGGFGAGGVTCCAMVPMRAVPARVICVLGLDVDAFPRPDPTGGFDLMVRYPRVGDRSQRLDDLYLFLETLLSATQTFYLSYVYKNIQDNTEKPPSVVVSQLLDSMESQYGIAEDAVVTRHHLHGHAPAYYLPGSPIQSYDRNHCISLPAMASRGLAGAIISDPLPEPEDGWRKVDIEDLCRFFRNPSKYIVTRRLGMSLAEPDDPLADESPIDLDGLDRYRIGEHLLTAGSEMADSDRDQQIHRADGRLPGGICGDILFDQVRVEAARLLPLISEAGVDPGGGLMELVRDCGPYQISGLIPSPNDEGQAIYRFGELRGADWVDAWIRHLALNLSEQWGDAASTTLVGFEKGRFMERRTVSARLGVVTEAASILETLLELYWRGLREPLPFFPKTSYSFIQARGSAETPNLARARAAAGKEWAGSGQFDSGDASNPYVRLCFRNRDLSEIPFEPVADTVIGPILAHRM